MHSQCLLHCLQTNAAGYHPSAGRRCIGRASCTAYESNLVAQGMSQEAAHLASLANAGLTQGVQAVATLYAPQVIQNNPQLFNQATQAASSLLQNIQ